MGGAALQRCIKGGVSVRLQPLRYLWGYAQRPTAMYGGLKACSSREYLRPQLSNRCLRVDARGVEKRDAPVGHIAQNQTIDVFLLFHSIDNHQ